MLNFSAGYLAENLHGLTENSMESDSESGCFRS